jgi:hypothetical protein
MFQVIYLLRQIPLFHKCGMVSYMINKQAVNVQLLLKCLLLIQPAFILDLALHVIYFLNILAEYDMCSPLL